MISIEFEQVTITYRRRYAANQIAHYYRSKKTLSDIVKAMRNTYLQCFQKTNRSQILEKLRWLEQHYQVKSLQFKEKKEQLKAQKFQTRINPHVNEIIKTAMVRHHHHQLPFDFPDFIPFVLGAFEQSIIDKNQLLTIVLLHDALNFFQVSALDVKLYKLDEGPFQPHQIYYWRKKHQKALEENKLEYYPYYALPLNDSWVELFIYEMIADDFKGPYMKELLEYTFKKRGILENVLITHYLHSHHQKHRIALIHALFPHDRPLMNETTEDSIRFLVAIEHLGHQMPSIKVAPDGVYFILPSIDTFNLLANILFQDEKILPCPVIGSFSPRLIRAFDEIPSIPKGKEKTPAQQHLAKLFPITETLHHPHRPVEIHYPGIPHEQKPHGFSCHPFLLTWHDLFHTWRASENEKNFIRKLRLLHDDKLNFNPLPMKGMSEPIWRLTDIDCSAGMVYRERRHHHFKAFELLIKNLVFNFKFPQVPENYLFLYYLIKNPIDLEPLPYIGCVKTLNLDLEVWSDFEFKTIFLKSHQAVEHYLRHHPEAPWMQIYWNHQLKPKSILEQHLIEKLDQCSCLALFTWPGIEIEFQENFYQNHLQKIGFDKTVLHNQKSELYFAFMLFYVQKNKCFDGMSLGEVIHFLHQFKQKWVMNLLSLVNKGSDLWGLFERCPHSSPIYLHLEFLMIQSADAFQEYLKTYRRELLPTSIETCSLWSIEKRKDVFYSIQNRQNHSSSPCTTHDSSNFSQKTI